MMIQDASFGGEINVDENVYTRSFGTMPNHTVYLDAIKGVDLRENALKSVCEIHTEVKAAITTSSPLMATGTSYSTTSGSIPVLFPSFVDPVVYNVTKRDTPLANGGIPRVSNRGLFADYVKKTVVQTGTWKGELSALPAATSTYTRTATAIKYAYTVGAISQQAIAASQSQGWINVFQSEVQAAYQSMKELEENTIINGDTTNATYTNGFNGLVASITTNTSNKSGAALQQAHIDTAFQTIREAKGHPTLIVTDWGTFNRIKQLYRPYLIATSGMQKLNFGFEEVSVDGVPVLPSIFMPQTATNRELHVLDTSQTAGGPNIQMRVLQDVTYVEKAKTADATEFYLSLYETMIIIQEAWCYRIYNLA